MGLQYFAGEPSASLLARKANASSSVISAPGEVFQCAASILSIAAGVPLRRTSLPFVPRGESRDLAYLDRSERSRDRREHQFPLQSEAFDTPCDERGRRTRTPRTDANRQATDTHARSSAQQSERQDNTRRPYG